jgi:hypothetical protein
LDPQQLVGRILVSVVASWHHYGTEPVSGPVDIWLIDGRQGSTHITVASDWCLLVEERAPFDGVDMGGYGRFDVTPAGDTPLAPHVGSTILAVREEFHPITGRMALELAFVGGRVRCDGWDGDLRLTAIEAGSS